MPSRLLCMAADSSGFNIQYEAVVVKVVRNKELNVMHARAADPTLMGPVAVWNCGINADNWGTKQNVTVTTDDGRTMTMKMRERCLRYIIKKFQTSAVQVMGLVDCGIHETGVEGLEQELQAIVTVSYTHLTLPTSDLV